MTVLRNDNRWVRSNAVFRDGVVNAYDKQNQRSGMTYVDFGLSVMSAAAVARFSDARVFDLSLIFSTLAAERRLAGMEMTSTFTRFDQCRASATLRPICSTGHTRMSFIKTNLDEAAAILRWLDLAPSTS